jgi:hypothetical protein
MKFEQGNIFGEERNLGTVKWQQEKKMKGKKETEG